MKDSHLPLLLVPEKQEEIKPWCEQVLGYMSLYSTRSKSLNNYNETEENYQFYHGLLDPKDYQYVTHTWGDTVPAELKHYHLLNSKIERMAGEVLSSPQKFSVETVNKDAASRKLNKLAATVVEGMTRAWNAELEKSLGIPLDLEDRTMAIPKEISQLSLQDFREMNEETIFDGLQYLFYDYSSQLESQLKRCFYDNTICSAEFGEVFIRNGHPYFERIDPRELTILSLGSKENLEECDAVLRKFYMPLNTVIMQFGAKLKEQNSYEEFKRFIGELQNFPAAANSPDSSVINDGSLLGLDGVHFRDSGLGIEVLVRKVWFKAVRQKKVRVLNPEWLKDGKPNPDYDEQRGATYEPVADDYEKKAGELIKKIPVAEPWFAVMVGDKFLAEYGKVKNIPKREGQLQNTELPVVGQIRYAPSIVQLGKHLGKLINIIFFHIEKAINIAGTKVLMVDVSRLPEGYDEARVVYEAKGMGIMYFDSTQIKGTSNPDSYKHMTQVDLGLDDNVTKLMALSVAIENAFNRLTGINDFWTGFVKPETAGVTMQQGSMAATVTTQSVFYSHTKFVEQVLNRLANLMPRAWSKRQQMSYILGDKGLRVFQLHEGLANDQYGVFVVNNYKDAQDKKFIMDLGMKALGSNAGALRDLIKIYYADSPVQAERILDEGIAALEEMRIKLEQQGNEIAAFKVQTEQTKAQVPIEVAKINAQSNITVAQIQSETKREIKENEIRFKEDKTDVDNAQLKK